MLKQTFLTGLKAFVPVVLTIAIVVWVFGAVETFFGNFIQYFIPAEYYFEGLGIVVGVVVIFFVGVLVNAWVIKYFYQFMDNVVKKIPGVKIVYNAAQDLMKFFGDEEQKKDQQAVTINTNLGKIVGFVTRGTLNNLPDELGPKDNILVYIPLSYQVGGLMVSCRREDVEPIVDWEMNRAMTFVLTAGMSGEKNRAK